MDDRVEVGGFTLAVGSSAGTLIEQGGGTKGVDEAEPLRQALDEPASAKAETGPAFAAEVEEASGSTAKIERAVALGKGIGEGQALDPTQLSLEVGALLDCLERLDRKKQHKKSLQMARALTSLLMLLKRWADLLKTLRGALRAAEQLGDQEAIGWARHELGTLRVAAGRRPSGTCRCSATGCARCCARKTWCVPGREAGRPHPCDWRCWRRRSWPSSAAASRPGWHSAAAPAAGRPSPRRMPATPTTDSREEIPATNRIPTATRRR